LREDMKGEHQAIIQYLSHAYAMGEVPIAFEVEAIARDEMRHLDWLGDAITELGGDPTMERETVDFSPGAPAVQLRKDVALEEGGIAQYRAHIEAIDDPEIRRLLARIVHDEMSHHETFIDLAAEAEAELPETPAAEGQPPSRLASILNQGIRHEYAVVLQYLYHGFKAESKDLAEEMQNIAINEMQHMGWLAEALTGRGGAPDMNHGELVLTDDAETNLKADIAVEREVTQNYTKQISEIEDEGLKGLIARIRDHEIYHDAVFSDFLKEVEAEEHNTKPKAEESKQPKPPEIPSVGSLIERE